jgi:hypothetical protein
MDSCASARAESKALNKSEISKTNPLNKGVRNVSETPSKGIGNLSSEEERICMDWSMYTSKAKLEWRRLCQTKIDPEVHRKLVQVWDTMPSKFNTGGFDSDNVYWNGDNGYVYRKGNLVVPREAQSLLIDWLRKRNEASDDRVVQELWKNYWWPTIAKDTIPLLSSEGRKTLKTEIIDDPPEDCEEKDCRRTMGQPRTPSYAITIRKPNEANETRQYICKKCNGQLGKTDRDGQTMVKRQKIRTHETSLQCVAHINIACIGTDDGDDNDNAANDDEWSKEEIYGSSGALKIEVKALVAPYGQRKRETSSKALVDCGAMGEHMHKAYASKYGYQLKPLREPIALYNVDGMRNKVGEITHYVKAYVKIGPHRETIRFFVSELGNHDLILGMRWLRKHDPTIGWRDATVRFDKCGKECYLPGGYDSIEVNGCRTDVSVNEIDPWRHTWMRYLRENNAPGTLEKEPNSWEAEPDNTMATIRCRDDTTTTVQDGQMETKMLRRSATISRLSEKFLETNDWLTKATETIRRLSPSIDLAAKSYNETDAERKLLPCHYEKFRKVFSAEEFDRFPPSRVWDHEIQLCLDAQPYSATRAYALTREEQIAQDAFLDEML